MIALVFKKINNTWFSTHEDGFKWFEKPNYSDSDVRWYIARFGGHVTDCNGVILDNF